ncbi:MAG: helix-turn-helix domain-containing protein [Gemmatimonadota bacterium]|nr:helix-turn-helix domain-containing protein [Gemmatimonadota bacterium]
MVTTEESGRRLSAEIGARVREFRVNAGLSGVKLAEAAGVSQPFLSQLESGQSSVAIATLYRIAKALGVQPSDLLPEAEPADIVGARSIEAQRLPL